MNLKDWQEKGQYTIINGHKVFFTDRGSGKETILILHGFPTCSLDYHKVLDQLAKKYRVIIHDHVGFGLTDKPTNFLYSFFDQTKIAIELWQSLGITEGHVIAHDYGTSIATELVALENEGSLPIKIKSYCLCNGSMLIDMSQLLPIQKILRTPYIGYLVGLLTNRYIFYRNMKRIWHDQSLIDWDEMGTQWKLVLHNKGRRVISSISRYTLERQKHYDRWIGGLKKSNNHFHIVWAEEDPIAIFPMATRLEYICSNSSLVSIPDSGHYPMLETPVRWLKAVLANPSL